MGRKRTKKENKGLPERWDFDHGAYYYMVPKGFESSWDGKRKFWLGRSIADAYKKWAERIEFSNKVVYVTDLFTRYEVEVLSKKSTSIRNKEGKMLIRLRRAFGKMKVADVLPRDIYAYIDERSKKVIIDGVELGGVAAAHRETDLFSSTFRKAVKWGIIDRHPFAGEIEKEKTEARNRYIENWELEEFLSLEPRKKKGDSAPFIQAYTILKCITGLRKQDLLTLKMSNLIEDGIKVKPLKTINSTKKEYIIGWTDALREAVDLCVSVRPCISPYLFCNRRGESYYNFEAKTPSSGFDSIWKRYMDRALSETKLKERFTEHDLRAKAGSDMDNDEKARLLLGHSNIATTRRVYRRKIEIIKPSR